jgi:hypothetical protein
LGDRTYHVSLIPESELRRRTAARARTRLVRFGAAAAVAVLSAAALYAQVFVQRRDYVRELDARAEQLRPVARTLLAKRQQLKLIQDQVDRSFSPLRILNEIAGVAPDSGVNFSRFSFDQHDGVVAQGSAVNPKLFDDLIDNIRGADLDAFPQLARARELYRTARVERSRQVWDFAVTIPFAEPETND